MNFIKTEPLLYDTEGAAAVLSLSAGFLEHLRGTERGPEFIKIQGRGKLGYSVRYTPEALRAWVEQQHNESPLDEASNA